MREHGPLRPEPATGSTNQPAGGDADWTVPRPGVRLGLTLALGLLGVALFPGTMEFVPNTFVGVEGWRGVVWLAAAIAAVCLLHWAEKDAPHRPAGAPARSRAERIVCGPAVALAAPLLLFAARPVGESARSSRRQLFINTAFALFPLLLAAGFTLTFFGRVLPRGLDGLTMAWLAFGIWTWLGCALLFLLSPWPAGVAIPRRNRRAKAASAATWVVIALAGIGIAFWALSGMSLNELPILIFLHVIPALCFLLIFMLTPWLAWPGLPKLGALPASRQAGPLGTALFFAVALIPLTVAAIMDRNMPTLYVLSGDLFASQFSGHVGGALDEPSITKWMLLFTLMFSPICLAHVAVARWACDRRTRLGYWLFAIPAAILCLYPLVILTLPFWWLVQYIGAMGVTLRRILGLCYALTGYVAILSYLCWIVWPPKRP